MRAPTGAVVANVLASFFFFYNTHTKGHADVVDKIQRYKIRKLKCRATLK